MIRPMVGLDIGSTKVACAIGMPYEHAPGFELIGTSLVSYPAIPEHWVGDPLMVGQTIERALEATGVEGEFHHAHVAVSHPKLRSERVMASIPLADEPIAIRARDVERLTTSALHQALGIDGEPLAVERLRCAGNGFDGVRDPRGLPATRLLGSFHILVMPRAARLAVVQAVESAGLETTHLTYAPLASYASAVEPQARHERVVLVDLGGLMTDVGLMAEGVLQSATVLQQGAVTLASTIATQLHVTVEQALAWVEEGLSCHREEVRVLTETSWNTLAGVIHTIVRDQPRPDLLLIGGRGALADGCVESIERATGIPTALSRSARTVTLGVLANQVGLSAAIGVLEMATQTLSRPMTSSSHAGFFNRLVDRTRTVLTEYF